MQKPDLAKQYKNYYTATTKPQLVELEKAQYISIGGTGDPAAAAFAERVQALYATGYTVKFIAKANGSDFTVPKLEGLWWFNRAEFDGLSLAAAPAKVPRDQWHYRLLLRMPLFITKTGVQAAIEQVVAKKQLALAGSIEWFELHEQRAVQMLHKGPFDKEPETLQQIADFIAQHGLHQNGKHHEIYLSDFRKTPPQKLKTILREPVQ